MSERPLPRRQSPWGLPEGDTRQPQAHRCNDRLEDVIQDLQMKATNGEGLRIKACFEGNLFETVPGPFKLFLECMKSKPGEEPVEPFYYLQLDPPKRSETKLE